MPKVRSGKSKSNNRYTDLEQQQAAAIVLEAGGLTKEALAKCEILFPGVSLPSIWRWTNKWRSIIGNKPMAVITANPVVLSAHNLVNDYLGAAYTMGAASLADESAWADASIRDRAAAWAKIEERRRLALGLSQHVIDTVKQIVQACNRLGYDHEAYLDDMLVGLNDQADVN